MLELFEEDKALYPPGVETPEEVVESYHCFRTLRRTSDTRALEEKVSGEDIDVVNKWDQKGKREKKVNQAMKHYYAHFELILKPFLRYTYAMWL